MKSIKYYIYNKTDYLKFLPEIIKIAKDFIFNKKGFKIERGGIRKSPTHPMQEYYWSVIIERVKECLENLGNNFIDKEDVHKFLKDQTKFYEVEQVFLKGKECFKKTHKSISFKGEMKETLEYFELIKQWCAENLDLIIPDPNKNWREND